jgi:hypothetical protein
MFFQTLMFAFQTYERISLERRFAARISYLRVVSHQGPNLTTFTHVLAIGRVLST